MRWRTDDRLNIRQSVKEAAEGAATSKHMASRFLEIAQSASQVTTIVAEIAVISQEQASSFAQVNRAITEMDKETQQNAAGSEESSSAAEELSSQAEELVALVGAFPDSGHIPAGVKVRST